MATSISNSPEETEALGEIWGRRAQRGWVIGLTGELGTGKTRFVKGMARGLDSSDRVHSPSFSLLNLYESGRLPLYHLDLYRLETLWDIAAAGLEDYLVHPAGVAVVEWIERWPPFDAMTRTIARVHLCQPTTHYWLRFETIDESRRRILCAECRPDDASAKTPYESDYP